MEFNLKNHEVYSFGLEKYPDKKSIWFLKKNHFGRN